MNGPPPQGRPVFDERATLMGEPDKQDTLETLRSIQHQMSVGKPVPYPSFEELMNAAKSQRRQRER